MKDLRQFLQVLERENEVVHIYEEVDPTLEIAEIHRRVVSSGGKALFFHRVKGSSFPVVTNLFGSEKRVELAFPSRPDLFIKNILQFLTTEFPPKFSTLWKKRSEILRLLRLGLTKRQKAPVTQCEMNPVDLESLPLLKLWPEDGGHFITLPLVYTQSLSGHSQNLGMYRIQRYDKTSTGLHFQIGKGGGFHLHEAEAVGRNLPVSIFVGGPPALIMSAIAPLPENVPELIFASLLQNKKLATTRIENHPHPLLADCEFALIGHALAHKRLPEGPFGDHFGYYSQIHDFPVFHCDRLFYRKDAIYPATVVGKPIQEDLFIGDYLQKLFSPLFPIVMPQVKQLHTFGETGFHPLAAAVVKERYEKECLASAFRIFGEGQLSLTKCLFITDAEIDLTDIKTLLKTILSRVNPETGIMIFSHTSNDTLDYTGPKLNRGSKVLFMGVGKEKRALPEEFRGPLPPGVKNAIAFAPGCLVIDGDVEPSSLAKHASFATWPLVIVACDAKKTTSSSLEFLWSVFTRFEPAADIYPKNTKINRNQLGFEFPFVIDCRMKPHYPKEVVCDSATKDKVDQRWHSYFAKR